MSKYLRAVLIEPSCEPREITLTDNWHQEIQSVIQRDGELAALIGEYLCFFYVASEIGRGHPPNVRYPMKPQQVPSRWTVLYGAVLVMGTRNILDNDEGSSEPVSLRSDEVTALVRKFCLGGPYRFSEPP